MKVDDFLRRVMQNRFHARFNVGDEHEEVKEEVKEEVRRAGSWGRISDNFNTGKFQKKI